MLAPGDRKRLRDVGFLDFEIDEYANAPTLFNLDNDTWQRVMRSRKNWMMGMIDEGSVKEDIEDAIMDWYDTKTKRSPWDWLRLEGSPVPYKTRRITDYKGALARRGQIKDYTASLAARRRARALGKESGVPYPGTYKRHTRVSW